jgi:DNA-binding transcriptional ArsR family regulator
MCEKAEAGAKQKQILRLWRRMTTKRQRQNGKTSLDKISVSDNLPLVDAYLQAGLDALGDGTRMAIFQRLSHGPMAVQELADTLPVSRPAVSQHLRVLKDAGLVRDSKSGTRRMYRLDPEGVARLRAHFDLVWERALGAFERAAVAPALPPRVKKEFGKSEAGKPQAGKRGEKHGKDSGRSGRPKKHPGSGVH